MPYNICPVCGSLSAPHPIFAPFCSAKCAVFAVNNSKSKADFEDKYKQKQITIADFTWCPYCDESPAKWQSYTLGVSYGQEHHICRVCNFKLFERDISGLFPMNKVEMIWKPDLGAYQVCFPFDKTMLDFLKAKIPSGFRTPDYDDNGKFRSWLIDKDYAEALLDVLKIKFRHCTFTVITKEKVDEYSQGAHLTVQFDPNISLHVFAKLLQDAGVINGKEPKWSELTILEATKMYRRAAMYYHPDRNPQLATEMSSLNKAWTELKGAYWK